VLSVMATVDKRMTPREINATIYTDSADVKISNIMNEINKKFP